MNKIEARHYNYANNNIGVHNGFTSIEELQTGASENPFLAKLKSENKILQDTIANQQKQIDIILSLLDSKKCAKQHKKRG